MNGIHRKAMLQPWLFLPRRILASFHDITDLLPSFVLPFDPICTLFFEPLACDRDVISGDPM